MKRYAIFGAGTVARHWINSDCAVKPEFLISTDGQTEEYCGLRVFSPDQIMDKSEFEVYISVTTSDMQCFNNSANLLFGSELKNWLISLGFSKVYSFDEAVIYFPGSIIKMADVEYLWMKSPHSEKIVGEIDAANRGKIDNLRDKLLDVESAELLEKLLKFRSTLSENDYCAPTTNYMQYLDETFLNGLPSEINILDLGAYVGDSLQLFLTKFPYSLNKIVAVEPGRVNFQKLLEFFLTLEPQDKSKCVALNLALGNRDSIGGVFGVGSGQTISDVGKTGILESPKNKTPQEFVGIFTVDTIFQNSAINFIKMDIEGAESLVIEGASKFISSNAPHMAICVYHKPQDLFEIPEMILQQNSNYRFLLRLYGQMGKELVLYCIPDNSKKDLVSNNPERN